MDTARERKAAQLTSQPIPLPQVLDAPTRAANGGRWRDSERPRRPSHLLASYCCTSAPLFGASLAWAAYLPAPWPFPLQQKPCAPAPSIPGRLTVESAGFLHPIKIQSVKVILVSSSILISSGLSYAESHSNHVRYPTARVFNSFVHHVSMCFDLKFVLLCAITMHVNSIMYNVDLWM